MIAICVVYNTAELFRRAFESIRHFHPDLRMIIIDGSDKNNPCFSYVNSLKSSMVQIYQMERNIGHGNGMHFALERCCSDIALIFDSDIVMLKSPIDGMTKMFSRGMYGIGWITTIGRDGFDFGTPGHHTGEKPIPYMHPYFMMISIPEYFRFHRFVHHGAPCYRAMVDIYDRGLSNKLLKQFPGLTGHTSGEGINWIGRPSEYIQHDFGGTRQSNKLNGIQEIQGKWIR